MPDRPRLSAAATTTRRSSRAGSDGGLVAFVVLITGFGIAIHGLGTAEQQRRVRRELPPA